MELRPDGVALTSVEEVFASLDRLLSDEAVRGVVITGSFASRDDARGVASIRTAADGERIAREHQERLARIASAKKPFVAAIDGPALGAGFELALACHARVCSERATLGLPEVKIGLIPRGNGLQRLAQLVGLEDAMAYVLRSANIPPARVVDEVVPSSLLTEVACKHAREHRIRASRFKPPLARHVIFRRARAELQQITRGHYPAAFAAIDVLETLAARGFDASADVEARAFGELAVSETAKHLIWFFLETRPPATRPTIEKIGIVDGDPQLAVDVALAGIEVRVRDREPARVLAHAARALEQRPAALARISATSGETGFRRASIVIDKDVARVGAARVSVHFGAKLLEVTRRDDSTDDAVALVVALGESLRRTVIVTRGPYTARLIRTLEQEAALLIADGVGHNALSEAIVDWGFARAPGLPGDGDAKFPPEEIQMRCALALVNEAIRCLGDAIDRPRDGDVAAILGSGFPPFRGGPFRYVDSIGAPEILRRVLLYRTRFGERFTPAPRLVELAQNNGRFY